MASRKSPSTKTPGEADTVLSKSGKSRARILDAAAKVLSEKGYAGMRLTDVAEVAELQAPAIYYYFKSREDLIEEVMWVGIADMRTNLENALAEIPDGTGPVDRIMVAVEAHLRHELEISDYSTASIRNSGQVPEHLRTRQNAETAEYGKIWRSLVRQAYEDQAIRQDLDLYMLQMLIMGCINWAVEWWTPRRGSVDDVVRNAQAFIRSALAES
ncbi:TetR/AcrR family transcriptional regulator [Gordonia sp. VNK21]|uniref:TetR/AcrR family transcriptional regulator n=1 Tax=Gordonia sp. VNK21 TaxID=3382483 RepID=UPI0038D46BC5